MASDAVAPSLRTLLARPELALRLAIPAEHLNSAALDAPIRWVHGTDLLDPTPFLSDGVALLTTGTQFGADAGDDVYRAYVHRLHSRGVLGLGFGTEVARAGIPAPLVEACQDQAIPLFEVPYRTPFIAVARAHAEAMAAEAYARRSWALSAQRALALAALRPDGLDATIAELARQMDAWVGLYDASGALTHAHPAAGLSGSLTTSQRARVDEEVGTMMRRGARAGSALEIDDAPVTVQTLGHGGRLRGAVAIAAALDQEARGVVTAVVAMAGLALEQQQLVGRAWSRLREGLVPLLFADQATLAREVATGVWGAWPPAPVVVAMTDDSAPAGADEWLERRASERRMFFGQDADGVVLIVSAGDRALLDEASARLGWRIGISADTDYAHLRRAREQAILARERGASGAATRFEDTSADLITELSTSSARTMAEAMLAPLRQHDETQGTTLRETVQVWLDEDCSNEAAAQALGVHRHTIRARILQVEALLGRDLASFAARAELWAALRLVAAPPAAE